MKNLKTITFLLFSLLLCQTMYSMNLHAMNPDFIKGYDSKNPITLSKPVLSAQDSQLWQLVFKACREETSDAARKVAISCLSALQQKGANLDATYLIKFDELTCERFGGMATAFFTPLVFAVSSKKADLVNALLDLGADINRLSTMGAPFQAAITNGNASILTTLLARGADINKVNEWGQSPIFTVLYHSDLKLFDFMNSHPDLDCTIQDNNGQNPLHFEVLKDHPNLNIVRKLLARGANPYVQDRLGKSALDYAREAKFKNVVVLLEGGDVDETEGFLDNTILTKSSKLKAAQQKLTMLSKASKKKKSARTESKKDTKPISPKKRSESEVEIEQLSPTKKLREALDDLTITQKVQSSARKVLLFNDDTFSSDGSDVENDAVQSQQSLAITITEDHIAERVHKWYDADFLAHKKLKVASADEFARSVYYHQIPLHVIQCIIAYGKKEPYVRNKTKNTIGESTKYYLRGEMVFENQYDNPWLHGRKYQPGYYHCTLNEQGEIYHVGFDPIRTGTTSLGAHLLLNEKIFDGFTQGIKHSFML